MAVVGAALTRQQHVLRPQDQILEVVLWALVVLAAVGMLALVAQFFAKRTASISACVFFGFLAGIMATNFLTDAVSGTQFTTVTGYLTSYGLELLFVALAVAGLVLFQRAAASAFAEPGANGGPATPTGNSGVTEGRHR
jgi:hypothetical protein